MKAGSRCLWERRFDLGRFNAVAFGITFPVLAFFTGLQAVNCTFGLVQKRLGLGSPCEPWMADQIYRCLFHPQALWKLFGLAIISILFWRTTVLSAYVALAPMLTMLIAFIWNVIGTNADCYTSLIDQGLAEPKRWALDTMRLLLVGTYSSTILMLILSLILAILVALYAWIKTPPIVG